MYKVCGCFPFVRCVCGREMLLKRATVCACGATIRAGSLKKKYGQYQKYWRLYGTVPESYNVEGQPYRFIVDVRWTPQEELNR